MESKTIWVFIVKNGDGIEYMNTYGSISKLIESELIVIGNETKGKYAVRRMLKPGLYKDHRYHIERKELIRSKRKN